ncbi:MAG TPA: clostripain-related cysteine peptidase [Candidatus Cloacimonas acidaminovorans]|nr:clostripain-related cysteine peptidase [Candidatus Cloacimonas acidaminovorans]HRU82206.1 clostripain-related cysteine peptidase [Candidatus Cloacimonas sp.]HOM78667.1 clostripain-related cysteine peptidase [Candidatus Cloacimonas acidaminovorans]HOS06721.1 clostripain-related cysteine peptidase [Candidatus Cloacimonas acidaminovorans]HPC50000.1 clostripain-related cysteine peptidase [Candidatus Cloacimonas acidaminovorans]
MKYFLIIFLLTIGIFLSAESWTVLLYMAADNNLAEMGRLDINSLESVAQPADLNLIVQADFPEGAKRYKIQQDNSEQITSPVLANLGTINSGDPNTLNSFIKWGFNRYPAQRKMLIIWSHGDSWYKDNSGKWICPDDNAQDLISVSGGELVLALSGIPHLDILLFDACSMQSIEVINEIHSFADYIIGSEDLVPQYGFPYEDIIPLFDGDFDELLAQIPELYVSSFLPGQGINPGGALWSVTCSVVKTELVPQFVQQIKNFAISQRFLAPKYFTVRNSCCSMNTGLADIDIRDFLEKAQTIWTSGTQNLLSLWTSIVISSCFTNPEEVGNIGTAAIWFPDSRFNFENGWRQYHKLNFSRSRWLSFVNSAIGNDTFPPETPILISQNLIYNTLQISLQANPDPDSLYYEITIDEGQHFQYFYTNPDNAVFTIMLQISQNGTYQIRAVDQSGNKSQPLIGNYTYSNPQASIIINPNPVSGTSLAVLRWWASEELAGKIQLEIYNLKGQKVINRYLGEVITGEGNFLLSAEPKFRALPSGVYILRLHLGNRKFTKKLTILY